MQVKLVQYVSPYIKYLPIRLTMPFLKLIGLGVIADLKAQIHEEGIENTLSHKVSCMHTRF